MNGEDDMHGDDFIKQHVASKPRRGLGSNIADAHRDAGESLAGAKNYDAIVARRRPDSAGNMTTHAAESDYRRKKNS